jgi:hypothetical protein
MYIINVIEDDEAKIGLYEIPISKDRFFLLYGNILGNGVKQNV